MLWGRKKEGKGGRKRGKEEREKGGERRKEKEEDLILLNLNKTSWLIINNLL